MFGGYRHNYSCGYHMEKHPNKLKLSNFKNGIQIRRGKSEPGLHEQSIKSSSSEWIPSWLDCAHSLPPILDVWRGHDQSRSSFEHRDWAKRNRWVILSGLLIDFVVAVVLSKRRCSIPGKSSIVCAIAIGLGAQTKLLGRSDNLGEFVMQGCDNGYVEIEIYRPGSPNSVHHSNLPFCSMCSRSHFWL